MDRRHTPRFPTFDYTGTYRYFWTICTHHRRRAFVRPDIVSTVRTQFLQASRARGVAVIAYCFMPDHLHLLLAGEREDGNAAKFVGTAKQASGYWFKQRFGQRLWQRTSWDRVLRTEDDTGTVVRYILANPVRAGLAARPLDYPFSGSFVYEREQLADAFFGDPAG